MLFPGESSTWDMGHVGNTRPTTGSLALSDCSNPFNTINLFTAVCAKVVPYVLVLTLRRADDAAKDHLTCSFGWTRGAPGDRLL